MLLLKVEVAALTLHDLLLWFSSYFPIVPLCPLFSCILKTIDGAILLMGFGLGVLLPTVQTPHNLGRFPRIGFPAFASTESMSQRLGLEHGSAGLAGFLWSIFDVKTLSCPLFLRLIRTLRRAGNCFLMGIELDPTHHTILGRIFLWFVPLIPPLDTALLAAGNRSPVCLKNGLADHTSLGINRPILGLLMLQLVKSAADLSTGELMRPNGNVHQITDHTDPWCVPSLTHSFFSS